MDEQAIGTRLWPSGTEHGVQWQIGNNDSEEPSASILRTEDAAADFFKMLVYHISPDCNRIIITMRNSNLIKLQPLGWNKSDWIIRAYVTSYKVLWQQVSQYSFNRGTFSMYNTSGVRPTSILRYLLHLQILFYFYP